MKKTRKIFWIIITFFLILNFTSFALAEDNTDISGKGANDIISAGSKWLSLGSTDDNTLGSTDDNTSVMSFANQLVGIGQVLVSVGVATILIVTAIMAIRWITATPDKQAKLKQQLIGLVVSIIVIFGAVGIWNVVRGIMGNIENSLGQNNNQNTVYFANLNSDIK